MMTARANEARGLTESREGTVSGQPKISGDYCPDRHHIQGVGDYKEEADG